MILSDADIADLFYRRLWFIDDTEIGLRNVFKITFVPGNELKNMIFSDILLTFCAVAVITLLLILFYFWQMDRVKKNFNEINNLSKDLQDEVGATLSSINIYSEIARAKSDGNTEVDTMLTKIVDGSQQALENINDIVWYQDFRNDRMKSLVAKMQSFAIPLLEENNINIVFEVNNDILEYTIPMQARQNTYRIFKEAVNNVVKYSKARKVIIKIKKSGNYFSLKVEDDGVGLNPSGVKKGNGLNIMITRTAAIRGIFSLNAAPGGGCRIELLCPIT